jgi:hypothetical protein
MRSARSLPQFEEPEEVLSPATLNDAVSAFLDSSEQGRFEEHFITALWIYNFLQGGLPGGNATGPISLLSSPAGEAFALHHRTRVPYQKPIPEVLAERLLP